MWRFLGGVASAVLLMTAGLLVWQAQANKPSPIPPAPAEATAQPLAMIDLAPPPVASERTREEKRFARYDKDKNGAVGRDEYLFNRQKGFAKLDTNRDGRISFDEYAVKTVTKFAAADKDRNNALNAAEFATTRVIRKVAKPKPNCPPALTRPVEPEAEES
jgi:soluble lytic murein transglycosylase-like protein